MYTRPPAGRFPRSMRIPENYGGSAFRPIVGEADDMRAATVPDEPPSPPPPSLPDEPSMQEAPSKEATVPTGRFSLGLPFLRRDGTGIGFEELLLIGLALLIAEDGAHDDLVWLLLLLLLIS